MDPTPVKEAPTTVNGTVPSVGPPKRVPNHDRRSREHWTESEVEVGGGVIRGDQGLELSQPVLGVKELVTFGQVGPQVLVGQPQLVQQDAGPIRLEAAAVEPDVEQPVVFVVRFGGGRVEQEFAVGFVAFQTNFRFERPDFIQPQRGDPIEIEERQGVLEFALGVVPADDAVPFFVEEAFQRGVDLAWVDHRALPQLGHIVVIKCRIGADHRSPFRQRLSDQQTVEGVFVVKRYLD